MPTQAGLIDFTAERQRHVRFLGREDVLEQLDKWLDRAGETGWVVVTGGPGMGKSAILAAWLARCEAAGVPVAWHFIRRQVADWDRPEVIATSLAAQIEVAFPTLQDVAAKPERRLIELLGRVSKHLGSTGSLVLVIDGLDETSAEAGENPLPRFLPPTLPIGIRVLCATRPTHPYLSWLVARSPARWLDLDDRRWASSNEATVRSFWDTVAVGYQTPLSISMLTAAVARAEGNVLHAIMLHDALRDLPAEERRIDRIPRGLKALIGEIWDHVDSHEAVRVGVGLLCVAQEALSLDVLEQLAGWSHDDRARFAHDARQLLLEEPETCNGVDAYRPRHDWVRELITERLGSSTVRAYHAMLSATLARWPACSDATARRYALRHALVHRMEAEDWVQAWALAADMGFLEAKCREVGVWEAEEDVLRAAKRCRAKCVEAFSRRFEDLARALARESHWLRTAPEAAAAVVWNRLRQLGWSASDIDGQLDVPAERATFLRVRSVATRRSSALVRSLVGHSGSITACTMTPDGRCVISASRDRTLKVWDLMSGRELATLTGHTDCVWACSVAKDGRHLVSASQYGTLRVWDLDNGRLLATLKGDARQVNVCAFSADGRRVVAAFADRTVDVWDVENGCLLFTLDDTFDTEATTGCLMGMDGKHLMWERNGRALNLRDLKTGNLGGSHSFYEESACAVTPDGCRVVWVSMFGMKVWDMENSGTLSTLAGQGGYASHACALTADGQYVVMMDGTALTDWDLERGGTVARLEDQYAFRCTITPDGRRVVFASFDGNLTVWDHGSDRTPIVLEGEDSFSAGACAVSPDGRYIASGTSDGILKVWDLENEGKFASQDGHVGRVTACAVTADGCRAVTASRGRFAAPSRDATLKLWDLDNGCLLTNLEEHTEPVDACAITPDGRRVASASRGGTLKVWDLDNGHLLTTLEGHNYWVNACAVAADGRRMVSASKKGMLKVWDLENGSALPDLEGHTREVTACAVTADSRRAVSASKDGTLKVWDLESGRVLASWEDNAYPVSACAVTADGQRVVSASRDGTLSVWDLHTGRILTNLDPHPLPTSACAITPDGCKVMWTSADRSLHVGDLETRPWHLESHLQRHADLVTGCAVTADGRRAVSASLDHTLKVWDLRSESALGTLKGHIERVNGCAVTPDGERAVSASADETLRIWDLASLQSIMMLKGHAGSVRACVVTEDGLHIVSASDDKTLRVWDLRRGTALATLRGHASAVRACVATSDGRYIVSASDDKTLRVWDLKKRDTAAVLEGHADCVTSCAVTADGSRLISGSTDRTLKVWDLDSGRMLLSLEGHLRGVDACAVTADGRRAVSVSRDRTLKVWDVATGRTCETRTGHQRVMHMCLTPDSQRVIASSDGGLKVWDVKTGQALATLDERGWVMACTTTSDGRHAVAAFSDRTIRVWELETYACVFIHRGDDTYVELAAAATRIVAGDGGGSIYFLEWPQRATTNSIKPEVSRRITGSSSPRTSEMPS